MASFFLYPEPSVDTLRFHDGLTLLACFGECVHPCDQYGACAAACWVRQSDAFQSRICDEAEFIHNLYRIMGTTISPGIYCLLANELRN